MGARRPWAARFIADKGIVALRDSKNTDKAPHLFTDAEYDTFVGGILRGELRCN
ncbi:DUF397 domain-containing protein [Streptomyces graminilatus]|uniref:DUF397 domain-containing protein n=1 Tax=Streptomyces graminilatus TaxID=1464070 RepID=UPI000B18C715|nr:DUF397 domain-containing protein [Streptomyces graminilatus]